MTKPRSSTRTKNPGAIRNEPGVSSYPPLREWLEKIEARCVWQHMNGAPNQRHSAVEMHTANGRVFIVVVHAEQRGWEVYSAADTNQITASLLDAEERLGIEPCCGEWGTGSGQHLDECPNYVEPAPKRATSHSGGPGFERWAEGAKGDEERSVPRTPRRPIDETRAIAAARCPLRTDGHIRTQCTREAGHTGACE